MVLYLDRMCQRGLHAVLWSHIGTLMHRLAAEPRCTAGLLFPSRSPSGTILLTPYSMVWDWRVSRAGSMLLYWPKLLYPNYSLLLFFPFLFFLSIGWYCGAGVFGLIGCIPLSFSLALPTFFNNNDNKSCPQSSIVHTFQRSPRSIPLIHSVYHWTCYFRSAKTAVSSESEVLFNWISTLNC